MDGDLCSLEVVMNKSVKEAESFNLSRSYGDFTKKWDALILSARNWLKVVNKDWVKANRQVLSSYPLNRQYGIVSNSIVRDSLVDIFRIDRELGRTKTKKFIKLVEQGDLNSHRDVIRQSMTANDYFEYCKIAYIAGQRKDEHVDKSLGRKMYALCR